MGQPPKKKITSEKLLETYIAAIFNDYKRRDKVKATKPQPYKGDPEELERFLRQLENVWALKPHKYKMDITKIRYEAYHTKIDLAVALRLPGGARATLDPMWSKCSVGMNPLLPTSVPLMLLLVAYLVWSLELD